MESYERWAPFYDAMRGDPAEPAAVVQGLLDRYAPEARTLLELACGTGSVLEQLARNYEVTGVDLSPAMLALARRRLPDVRFVEGDMTTLDLGETFDAVVCVADAINHLRPFRAWERAFARARAHVADGGVFVFDMNTQLHLSQLAADPPLTAWSDDGDFTMLDVVEDGRDGAIVDVTVFERDGDSYRLHSAQIPEISYPITRVRAALEKRFARVHVHDPYRARPSALSERLFFSAST